MFSRVALAWPVSLSKTIANEAVTFGFNDGATATPVGQTFQLATSDEFDTTAGGSVAIICATGTSADMSDGDSRDGFIKEMTCLTSKLSLSK